jgi:FHA domain-containing protein
VAFTDTPNDDTVEAAERQGIPFLHLRDGDGQMQIVGLDARKRTYAIGRRSQADIALPWDREVSRLHAEITRLAGEWTISDDGLSQNGTYVNEVRLSGRRRLTDGDLIRVGRTSMTFRAPPSGTGVLTLLPGELSATTALSEQQHLVLRELCRPLARDPGAPPAADQTIAEALAIPPDVASSEVRGLLSAFGLSDLPAAEARLEAAQAALASGLVRFDDAR